jgi:glycyl-tRNA synthetase beta chain
MSDRLASGATDKGADFLLELLSEEIPARMQARARNELARMFAECTGEAGLATGAIDVYSTPRRLVLIARDVADFVEPKRVEVKGPRAGAPPQALEGFLRKTGLSREQLQERNGVFFAVVEMVGLTSAAVLQDTIARILADFHWPKSMRWGAGTMRWVRPLQGIVAILGNEILPIAAEGVESSATTTGHRFHHPGPITIGGAHDYVEKLRACHVIVDQDERERLIREGAEAAAREAGLALLCDEGLVVENASLTEWPVPLLGRFDAEFLDVPREVIVLTMRTNQKYFACTGESGALAPAFVCVANVDATDGGQSIVEGNKRVLAARLADARFFWEQDLKVPLEEQAKKLSGIVFHEKLGTVADKVERVAKLARWLAEEGIVQGAQPDEAERAARLSKADLVTGMVGEFPELQGIIGGYLARAQGEPNAVADAVGDHYKPGGQGDEVPTTPVTVAVSLSDKLDTLAGFFCVGEKPTGSKDPFALRRAAIGVLALTQQNDLRLNLSEPFEIARDILHRQLPGAYLIGTVEFGGREVDHRAVELVAFFADRLKVQQREAGVRHDLIDAVFALGGEDDLVRLLARVKALQGFVETSDGGDLLTAYKRAANILKKEEGSWTPDQVREDDLEAGEQTLVSALDDAEPRASAAIDAEDFGAAMSALASLRQPIDAFFDHVTVNVVDPGTRARRLSLLMRFRNAVNRVADFSKIEG